LIEQNVLPFATVVGLSADDYKKLLLDLATAGIAGGAVYDAVIARSAELAAVDHLVTLNIGHFQRVWPAGGARIISPLAIAPPHLQSVGQCARSATLGNELSSGPLPTLHCARGSARYPQKSPANLKDAHQRTELRHAFPLAHRERARGEGRLPQKILGNSHRCSSTRIRRSQVAPRS
jgi:hypothetical protein